MATADWPDVTPLPEGWLVAVIIDSITRTRAMENRDHLATDAALDRLERHFAHG